MLKFITYCYLTLTLPLINSQNVHFDTPEGNFVLLSMVLNVSLLNKYDQSHSSGIFMHICTQVENLVAVLGPNNILVFKKNSSILILCDLFILTITGLYYGSNHKCHLKFMCQAPYLVDGVLGSW